MIEIEDTGNQSRFVNQFNDNTDNGLLRVRKAAISLESKIYGRVWLGQQEMAKDNINKDTIVIKGLDQTMHQDFYMNWSFFLRQKGFNNAEAFSSSTPTFRDIGRCYSTSSSAFDCSTRRQEVRYDTPEWWGFVGSASWGEDDIWSASLRYQKEWDNWKVGAGYAYEDFTDELVNNGGGGVFNQGFKRDIGRNGREWRPSSTSQPACSCGPLTATPKTTTIGVQYRRFYRQGPARHACLGYCRWYQSRVCMEWSWPRFVGRDYYLGRLTKDQDGLGGFTRTTVSSSISGTASSYAVCDGEVSAGAFPGIPFKTEITSLRDYQMVPRRRSGDQLRGAQYLCRLPAHRA